MDVSPSLEDLVNPIKGLRELITPAVLVEKTQNIATHDWVHTILEVSEESLAARGWKMSVFQRVHNFLYW